MAASFPSSTSSSTLAEQYAEMRSSLSQARATVAAMEQGQGTPQAAAGAGKDLADIVTQCEQLLAEGQGPHVSRVWAARLQQVQRQATSLRASLMSCMSAAYHTAQHQTQREELLAGRSAVSAASLDVGYAAKESGHLHRSSSLLDSITDTAAATLGDLRTQRRALKSVQRAVLDMAAALGVSRGVIRSIEQRMSEDKWVLYAGMAVVLLVLGLLIWWIS